MDSPSVLLCCCYADSFVGMETFGLRKQVPLGTTTVDLKWH